MNKRCKAEALIKEGRVLFSKNNLACAKDKFKQAARLFSLLKDSGKQSWALAAAAYVAITNKDFDEGLILFNQAAQLGYTDLDKLNDLANLKYKGISLKELSSFKQIYKLVHNNATSVAITKYQSQNIEPWQWMKYCDKKDLVCLKKKLPKLKSTKEFDVFKECLAWVNKCFVHDAVNKPSNSNPSTILKEAANKKGFTCQEFSILQAAVLQAHGHPARVIAVLKNNYGYGTGKGHWVIEAWSDDFNKWILLDPQNNCYWMAGEEVLNAFEIRDYVLTGKTQQIEPYVNGRKAPSLKSWLEYFNVIWIYNNQNFFFNWDPLGDNEELGGHPHLLFQNKTRGYFKQHREKDYLYPNMNKIDYKLRYHDRKLSFLLSNSCPFFKNYEISHNNGAWSECKSEFIKQPMRGKNVFKIRIQNIFNRKTKNVILEVNKYK